MAEPDPGNDYAAFVNCDHGGTFTDFASVALLSLDMAREEPDEGSVAFLLVRAQVNAQLATAAALDRLAEIGWDAAKGAGHIE